MIDNLATFNISIFAKGVHFLFQAGWKRRHSSAGLVKGNAFLRNSNPQQYYFVAVRIKKDCV